MDAIRHAAGVPRSAFIKLIVLGHLILVAGILGFLLLEGPNRFVVGLGGIGLGSAMAVLALFQLRATGTWKFVRLELDDREVDPLLLEESDIDLDEELKPPRVRRGQEVRFKLSLQALRDIHILGASCSLRLKKYHGKDHAGRRFAIGHQFEESCAARESIDRLRQGEKATFRFGATIPQDQPASGDDLHWIAHLEVQASDGPTFATEATLVVD